ncbi:MAG: slipin family protein [Oscillibacter sp.]|nr:slipin family protein [Oscillibacter sp.]
MHYVTVNENQRGLLFRHGKLQGLLSPGRHLLYGGRRAELILLSQPVHSPSCGLETLLQCPEIAQAAAVAEVPDQHLALHFADGKFACVLPQGKFAYWNILEKHEFRLVDISRPEVDESVPAYVFSEMPGSYFTRVDVASYERGRLCLNNRFERLLEPGTYYFWKRTPVKVDVSLVDTRLTQMDITGQEILTQDKVSLRINFVCNYRITDYVRSFTEIDDFREQLHVAAQLALRDYVGKHKLDEILETKEEISRYVLQRLKEQEKTLFVEISGGGVKDIILPGEIREIMNTVLAAEKRAQASVITRREEVASTRSLLNTAKLMDENQTLMRLKELEYIERICANVGSIHLNGSGDLLAQLTEILRG